MSTVPQDLVEIARRTGRIWWEFWRNSQRHEIKAAACVTRTWPGAEGDAGWEATAQAWAAAQAQAVCDRLDIEEPRAIRIATAVEDPEARLTNEVRQQLDKIAAYLDSHPNVTATQVRDVLRPRIVTAVSSIRDLTAGF